MPRIWRVGGKVPLNVYEGDKPMFQCHTPEDAARIVALLNGDAVREVGRKLAEALTRMLEFRAHLSGCEVDYTDFCTCGLKGIADSARAALARYTAQSATPCQHYNLEAGGKCLDCGVVMTFLGEDGGRERG